MNGLRDRLEVHRREALILLQETSRTAQLYEGFRFAGAVCHLARAQVLIAEELKYLSGGSKKEEEATSEDLVGRPAANEGATPVDEIGLTTSPEAAWD